MKTTMIIVGGGRGGRRNCRHRLRRRRQHNRRRRCHLHSWSTVDQFNKKRVLLPETLDISYSGVHGNKKFPVEGPEVVR